MQHLPFDLVHVIGLSLDARSATHLAATCKTFREWHDDEFWRRWATASYGTDFWKAAKRRPRSKSKPLHTWRAEVVRLERFQAFVVHLEGRRWHPHDIRQLWQVMDGR